VVCWAYCSALKTKEASSPETSVNITSQMIVIISLSVLFYLDFVDITFSFVNEPA
jgi:hypothetical protein